MKSHAKQQQQPVFHVSRDFWTKVLSTWLAIGLLWFLMGIAWAPTAKLYRQGLVLFFWLPTLICLGSHWRIFCSVLLPNKGVLIPLLFFLVWANISIIWSSGEEHSTELRRILYVFLFFSGVIYLSHTTRYRPSQLMTTAAYGLALAAVVSITMQYGFEGHALSSRLSGIGSTEHPILGGYVMGLMLLWLSGNLPQQTIPKAVGLLAMAMMLLFIVLTQSRGLWVALLGTAIIYSVIQGGRTQWIVTGALLLGCALGYWFFSSYVTARGTSSRPEIFKASLEMIAAKPWLGLGLSSEYNIVVGRHTFSHSHNLFLHIAIMHGVLGLVLWLAAWGYSFKIAWSYRRRPEGAALMKGFIFCSIALLFDGGSLLKSPRPEWFLSWLPIALAISLQTYVYTTQKETTTSDTSRLLSIT